MGAVAENRRLLGGGQVQLTRRCEKRGTCGKGNPFSLSLAVHGAASRCATVNDGCEATIDEFVTVAGLQSWLSDLFAAPPRCKDFTCYPHDFDSSRDRVLPWLRRRPLLPSISAVSLSLRLPASQCATPMPHANNKAPRDDLLVARTDATAEGQKTLGVWQLAWPSMLSNLLGTLGGLISMKVVGGIGPGAIAAVTSGNQIFFALQTIMMAISAGTTALVARAWGSGDYEEAIAITKTSILVAGLAALFMTLPGVLFATQIASVFGLDAQTTEMSGAFIRWSSAFNVVFALNMILGSALRAAGDAKTPLWLGVGTNVIYLGMIFVCVYGYGALPAMGVAGAAVANGVAFTIASVLLFALWRADRLKLGWNNARYWHKGRVQELVHIGYPAGVEQIIGRIGFFVFLGIIGTYYGRDAFAAYGIGVNILSVCFVVGFGFSIASSTLVGQNLGAGDPAAATRAGWRSLRLALVAMSVAAVLVIAVAGPLARFMSKDPIVVGYTISFIYILGAMMPLMAIDFSIGGALRGAGDTRHPLRATLVGLIVMRCGLAILFAWLHFSVIWIYGALIGDYLAKGAILLMRYRSGRWRKVFQKMQERREGREPLRTPLRPPLTPPASNA